MATNVGFKRGLHASLPINSATEGVFYLTTDTERFYVGKNDGTLAELNKSVRTVSEVKNLPALAGTDVAVGDFYYAIKENILAVCIESSSTASGKDWRQVNPDTDTDTKVHSVSFAAATASNIATITETIKMADKDGNVLTNQDKTATFKIKGGNGVKVSSSGSEVTLTGDYNHTVVSTGTVNEAGIDLMASGTKQGDTIKIKGGNNNVTVAADAANKTITISSKDTTVKSGTLDFEAATGKISLVLKDQDGNNLVNISDTDKIFYKVGDDATEYVPGQTLPVYTKTQVDSLFKGLNGLTYKGTVGSTGTITSLPTTNVESGDMYLVSGTGATGSGKTGKTGDLFIATGTEDASTGFISGTITWTFVPSGDDAQTDTTYYGAATAGTTHSWKLKDKGGSTQGGIDLNPGTAIELSSTTGTDNNGQLLTTTIKHADISRTDDIKDAPPTTGNTTQVITGVETNAQGHVTKVTGVKLNGDHLSGYTLSGTDTVTSTKVTLKHELASGNGTKSSATDVIESTSLTFAQVTDGYSINLEWGSF